MNERFIIVYLVGYDTGRETQFALVETKKDVLEFILSTSRTKMFDDPSTVQKVFSIDEMGRSTNYELVLKGFYPELREVTE